MTPLLVLGTKIIHSARSCIKMEQEADDLFDSPRVCSFYGIMNPIELAARYAAYTRFKTLHKNSARSTTDALTFADENYHRYLDVGLASQGVGRLLANIIASRKQAEQDNAPSWETELASAHLCNAR